MKYTEEMETRMREVCANGVTEDVIEGLVEELDAPRRSVTAKLRKLGFDVPKKQPDAPKFSEAQTADLVSFLEAHSKEKTAEEIAEELFNGEFNARQITGKALSLEMTDHIKPAEKKVAPKKFTEEEEEEITAMASEGAYLEDIAAKLNKTVNSIRGKLLSMGLKAEQKVKKASKSDSYEGLEGMLNLTVAQIAEKFEAAGNPKTERGIKTTLSRRKLQCADYPKKAASDS